MRRGRGRGSERYWPFLRMQRESFGGRRSDDCLMKLIELGHGYIYRIIMERLAGIVDYRSASSIKLLEIE